MASSDLAVSGRQAHRTGGEVRTISVQGRAGKGRILPSLGLLAVQLRVLFILRSGYLGPELCVTVARARSEAGGAVRCSLPGHDSGNVQFPGGPMTTRAWQRPGGWTQQISVCPVAVLNSR